MRYLVLVGLVACATPTAPPFLGTAVRVENDQTVYFGASKMDFGGTSIRLPTRLDIDSVPVLEEPTQCGPLSRIGTALFPAVSATGDVANGRSTGFDILWRGPVAARVRVSYELPYQCGTVMSSLTGTSTFTFFGNDRIVRVDENLVASTAAQSLPAASTCGCSSPAPYSHMSYWTFSNGQVHDASFVMGPVQDAAACIPIDTVMVGVKYAGTGVFADNSDGPPMVEQTFFSNDASNWPGGGAPVARSESVLVAVTRNGTTDPAACAEAVSHLEDYPPIVLNGGDVIEPDGGIYHATKRYQEAVTISTNARTIPSFFALDIDLGGARHVRVTDDFGDAQVYNVQQLDDGHLLFDLPPISPTDRSRVTIEPID